MIKCNGLRRVMLVGGIFFSGTVHAAIEPSALLPTVAQPEQVRKSIIDSRPAAPSTRASAINALETATPPINPQATKIRFKLASLILEGNHVYSTQELEKLYSKDLGKVISVADLYRIVQSITNYYRNHGYILSRALLPPQHVAKGVVHVRVVEGFISKVNVIGHPYKAKHIIERYSEQIKQARPLQLKILEYVLLVANEIPGVSTRAVLQPSATVPGAAELNLDTNITRLTGYLSYDNYGSRYVGPQQITANLGLNSLMLSGDVAQITYAKTPKGQELNFTDISYNLPVGGHGLRWTVDGNHTLTHPLFFLRELQIKGVVDTYNMQLQYPLIRTQSQSLSLQGGANYIDSIVTALDAPLYADHLRTLTVSANYLGVDRWHGTNTVNATLGKGLLFFWCYREYYDNDDFTVWGQRRIY